MSDASQRGTIGDRAVLVRALAEVSKGDRSAFAQVYAKTSAKLFGICLRILKNRSEAEEAMQEAYVNVWQKAGSFDPARSSPITWLAALARNRSIDRLRSLGARPADPMGAEALEVPDPGVPVSDVLELSDEAQRLSGCIGELEVKQAGVIREAFFGGATYGELATRQSVPLGTMKSWVRRGLIKLKECLER
ncbi:MAG: sigma-70 family RNA polymerase sigma factor [Sphingosinicella sp.]|nr:sigma-70 family RNA polymerase sigma factor [Sphingosinicella sp.]